VRCGNLTTSFEIASYTHRRLMKGHDDIRLTLRNAETIGIFEQAARPSSPPPSDLPRFSRVTYNQLTPPHCSAHTLGDMLRCLIAAP
jgi:hypothetical protein